MPKRLRATFQMMTLDGRTVIKLAKEKKGRGRNPYFFENLSQGAGECTCVSRVLLPCRIIRTTVAQTSRKCRFSSMSFQVHGPFRHQDGRFSRVLAL